ncbi:MAG TPA: DUF4340 domain-containing protein, partial [bacterium]
MSRSTWILIVLLAASLAWAYASTTKQAITPGREALETIWTVPATAIKKVEYRSGATRVAVSVTARKEGQGNYLWVEGEGLQQRQPPPQRKKGRQPPPPPASEEPTQDAFMGGQQAQKFLEEMAALQAVRVLGPSKNFKLEDFGLGGAEKSTLVIERDGGAPLRLELGAITAGNATRYALSGVDDKVYLVRNGNWRSITNVRRFMDRELFPFPVQEAQRVEIQDGGRKLTMHRLSVAQTEPNKWARSPQDKAGDPALQEIFNSLLRIKTLRYAAADTVSKANPDLTVTLVKDGATSGTLRLFPEQKGEVVAVSTYTERPVTLNVALAKALLDKTRAALK